MIGVEKESLDGVAVAYGPGLIGSLLIGIETAKALALSWGKKLIRVNHLEAHVAANWIVDEERQTVPCLPAVGLIISGGHTDLVLINDFGIWKWLGGTMDDAAGEAFDKAARILDLGYPGGPAIAKMAMEFANSNLQITKELRLPRPMMYEPNLKMSFSGLKAALAKRTKELNEGQRKALAREFNEAVVDVLVKKAALAIDTYQPRSFLVAGGVAANSMIREGLQEMVVSKRVDIFIPKLKYCGDNAAMVGAAAILKPEKAEISSLSPEPGLMISE